MVHLYVFPEIWLIFCRLGHHVYWNHDGETEVATLISAGGDQQLVTQSHIVDLIDSAILSLVQSSHQILFEIDGPGWYGYEDVS